MDCFIKTVTREGPLKLWVGFPTFYARVGTHAMTVIFNQIHINCSRLYSLWMLYIGMLIIIGKVNIFIEKIITYNFYKILNFIKIL